ncbi:MAG TPA: Scr1 family TA system antitoxin-like transcriptional regulator, partial [Actinomycetes bacterium]
SGAFIICRFAEQMDPDIVYLEHTTSDLYLQDRDEVKRYLTAFARLQAAALTPQRSAQYLEVLAGKA